MECLKTEVAINFSTNLHSDYRSDHFIIFTQPRLLKISNTWEKRFDHLLEMGREEIQSNFIPAADEGFNTCFEHQGRGDYLSFLGVIGSVEKFPLVDLQLYFLIFKPEFTWNYDGIQDILGHFRTFQDILGQI